MRKLAAGFGLSCLCISASAFWEPLLADGGGAYFSGEELYRSGRGAFSIGYVTAIHDGDLTSSPLGERYCVPKGVTNGQLTDVAWLYLEKNPASRHLHAAYLIRQSWREAWRCTDPSKVAP